MKYIREILVGVAILLSGSAIGYFGNKANAIELNKTQIQLNQADLTEIKLKVGEISIYRIKRIEQDIQELKETMKSESEKEEARQKQLIHEIRKNGRN